MIGKRSRCIYCWLKDPLGDLIPCNSLHKCFLAESIIKFKKGDYIIRPNDSISKLFCIRNGVVKIYNNVHNNKEFVVWIAGKGEILGLDSYLNNKLFPFYAIAIKNVSACVFDVSQMNSLIRDNPFLINSLGNKLCRKIDLMEERIGSVYNKSKKEQLVDFLMLSTSFAGKSYSQTKLKYSVADISNITGISKSYVNKLLHDFQENGIFNIEKKHLKSITSKNTNARIKKNT